jgi:hypothetical protein
MRPALSDYVAALGAELLKLKRSLALWLTFLLPAVPVALQFINYLQRGEALLPENRDPWVWMTQNIMIVWAVFILPLFVAMLTSLLAALDHNAQAWKHLFALPVRRSTIFAAKKSIGMVLLADASIALVCWTLAAGYGLHVLRPELGFAATPPLGRILVLAVSTWLTSWLLYSIHSWISLRWASFIPNLGVAVAALFGSFVITASSYWKFYPWALPASVENLFHAAMEDSSSWGGIPDAAIIPLITGSLGGIVVMTLGVFFLSRRDVI